MNLYDILSEAEKLITTLKKMYYEVKWALVKPIHVEFIHKKRKKKTFTKPVFNYDYLREPQKYKPKYHYTPKSCTSYTSYKIVNKGKAQFPTEEVTKGTSLTFKEAQKAGFQFKYTSRRGDVSILSIHIRSDKTVIPQYIEGRPVTRVCTENRIIVDEAVTLTALYLPETVSYISSLKADCISEVYIDGRAVIADRAFSGLPNLKKVVLNQGADIGEYAFAYCPSLESVELKNSSIGKLCFTDCPRLKDIVIDNCIRCNGQAFRNTPFEKSGGMMIAGKTLVKCNLSQKVITVPEGIEIIGEYAFSDNKTVERVVLPETVEEIKEYAFRRCSSLEDINLNRVKYIRDRAFESCFKLDGRVISRHLPYINGNPFSNTALEKENMTPDGPVIKGILTHGIPSGEKVWKLSSSIKEISWRYHNYCSYLTEHNETAVIPSSVKHMTMSGFSRFERIVIKNTDTEIYFDSKPYFNFLTRKWDFCLSFETKDGVSDFMLYFPKFQCDEPKYKVIMDFYNGVMSGYFNIYSAYRYDSGILSIGLSYRQMLDISYRRVKGGYLLSECHRRQYMEFLTVHRKKGYKYATQENAPEKAEFFVSLS